MVTPAQLEAYKAIIAADPAQVVSGTFELIPPGDRPFYCLFAVGTEPNNRHRRTTRLRLLRGRRGRADPRSPRHGPQHATSPSTLATVLHSRSPSRCRSTSAASRRRRSKVVRRHSQDGSGWRFDPKVLLDQALTRPPGDSGCAPIPGCVVIRRVRQRRGARRCADHVDRPGERLDSRHVRGRRGHRHHPRPWRVDGSADRNLGEPHPRRAGAGARHRSSVRVAIGRRTNRRASPSGVARCVDRPPEPHR